MPAKERTTELGQPRRSKRLKSDRGKGASDDPRETSVASRVSFPGTQMSRRDLDPLGIAINRDGVETVSVVWRQG